MLRRWLTVLIAFVLLVSGTSGAGKVEGIGAHPLSKTTVSMWLSDVVDGKPRALAIAYFVGAPGWHDRKWKTDYSFHINGEKDALYRLVSDDVVLSLLITADLETVVIQGKRFALVSSNVFLVQNADGGAKKETVKDLGHFALEPTDGQPESLDVLKRNPKLATAVLGNDLSGLTRP